MEALAFIPEFEDEDLIMSQLLANYCSVTNDMNHQTSSSQSALSPSSHECPLATKMEGIANLYSRRIMATNYYDPEPFHPWDGATSTTNFFLSQSEEDAGMDQVMRNCNVLDHEVAVSENSKKRSFSTSANHVQRNERNVKPKKIDQMQVLSRKIADSCSSGDDEPMNTNSHQNLSPKARTSKVLATDPQSTYARNRRDKINSRLRILQNLIPNGTKVDMSTMLEDAVEYVKFLQLQIKLLSSDEMWMYAPVLNNLNRHWNS